MASVEKGRAFLDGLRKRGGAELLKAQTPLTPAPKSAPAKRDRPRRNHSEALIVPSDTGVTAVLLNEDNLALAFAKQHQDALRFSHDHGHWFVWDGNRWREDGTELAFEWTRQLCRTLNPEGKKTFAKSSTCAGVERFARA